MVTTFQTPEKMEKRLENLKQQTGLSKSEICRTALANYLKEWEK